MDSIHNDFGNVFLWTFWLFIMIGALAVWVLVLVDLFAQRELNGWVKAGWAVVLIVLPVLGVLIYLIVRGVSTHRLARSYREM